MRLGFNEYRAEHGQYILQTQFKNYSEDSMGGGYALPKATSRVDSRQKLPFGSLLIACDKLTI